MLLKIIDKSIGGTIMVADAVFAGKLRQNLLCDLFAVFDAPLVEWIDIPYDPLHENFMLIQSNQFT